MFWGLNYAEDHQLFAIKETVGPRAKINGDKEDALREAQASDVHTPSSLPSAYHLQSPLRTALTAIPPLNIGGHLAVSSSRTSAEDHQHPDGAMALRNGVRVFEGDFGAFDGEKGVSQHSSLRPLGGTKFRVPTIRKQFGHPLEKH